MNTEDRPKPGTVWQHAKGGVYQIMINCTIEATDTPAVMHHSLNVVGRDDYWVRPLDEFLQRFKPLDLTVIALAEIAKADHQPAET